jgi:membrane protein implicated in regulation of membrane protease activity
MWDSFTEALSKAHTSLSGIFQHLDKVLTFWTFLAIGIAASLFVIVTLVMGEVGEMFGGDHDFDHGGHEGTPDHDLGVGHTSDMAGLKAPHLFSFRIIITFVSGFGLVGAIASWAGSSILASCTYGVIAGLVMAGLMYVFVSYLASQQASINISDSDMLNKEAQVVVKIPPDAVGQVQFNTTTGTMTKLAMSIDHTEIPEGAVVKIEKITGQTAFVSRVVEEQH